MALTAPPGRVKADREPNGAAGGRGRRRSAYEAPRAAADRSTRISGAESKRRRHPRLPAPQSRVTGLVRLVALRHRLGIELEQRVAQPLHEPAMHDPDTGLPSGAREKPVPGARDE